MSYQRAVQLLEKVAEKKKRNKKYNPNKVKQKADSAAKAAAPKNVAVTKSTSAMPAVTKYSKIPTGMSLGKKIAIGAGVTAAAAGTAALVHKVRNRDK